MYFIAHTLPRIAFFESLPKYIKTIAIPIISTVSSLGFYRFLLTAIMHAMDRVHLVKSFVLGPAFVEGTWVGIAEIETTRFALVVDRISQNWDSIEINGTGYHQNGKKHSVWRSHAVIIDLNQGILKYCFETTPVYGSSEIQGFAKLEMIRKKRYFPPTALHGTYTEHGPTQRIPLSEWKVSNILIDDIDAVRAFIQKIDQPNSAIHFSTHQRRSILNTAFKLTRKN